MFKNPSVLYKVSFAKYAVAFFNISGSCFVIFKSSATLTTLSPSFKINCTVESLNYLLYLLFLMLTLIHFISESFNFEYKFRLPFHLELV
jgi:hypothetical protein